MANHKSALKRAKQSETKRLRNKAVKTRVKHLVKNVHQAVDGAGRHEDAVPGLGLETMQAILGSSLGDCLLQLGCVDALSETGVNLAAGIGVEDDPGFGLAQIGSLHLGRELIVGMNLHG